MRHPGRIQDHSGQIQGHSDQVWWHSVQVQILAGPVQGHPGKLQDCSGQIQKHWGQVRVRSGQEQGHSGQVQPGKFSSSLMPLSPVDIHMAYNLCINTCFNSLKGQCHEIFCFWFFSWISFPPAPEYSIKTVSNFFENLRRYSQQVCHRCQRHRWQMEKILNNFVRSPLGNRGNIYVNFCLQVHF